MAMTPSLIALNRFGLGARPGDTPVADPRRWVEDQFARYQPTVMQADMLASRTQIVQDIMDYQAAQGPARDQGGGFGASPAMVAPAMPAMAAPAMSAPVANTMQPMPMADANAARSAEPKSIVRDQHILQAGRRIRNAVATDTPFVERMVHFWANHFAISVDKMELVGLGGLMEFEAIRPHVLGRFEDMLLAVEQHPAMLLYLDQAHRWARQHGGHPRQPQRAQVGGPQ
jgi:uncharacterized protein (DUF1800 family)